MRHQETNSSEKPWSEGAKSKSVKQGHELKVKGGANQWSCESGRWWLLKKKKGKKKREKAGQSQRGLQNYLWPVSFASSFLLVFKWKSSGASFLNHLLVMVSLILVLVDHYFLWLWSLFFLATYMQYSCSMSYWFLGLCTLLSHLY